MPLRSRVPLFKARKLLAWMAFFTPEPSFTVPPLMTNCPLIELIPTPLRPVTAEVAGAKVRVPAPALTKPIAALV